MHPLTTAVLAADAELPQPVAGGWQLIVAALAGIAVIVLLIVAHEAAPLPRPDLRRPRPSASSRARTSTPS